jgi:hypothetical protein
MSDSQTLFVKIRKSCSPHHRQADFAFAAVVAVLAEIDSLPGVQAKKHFHDFHLLPPLLKKKPGRQKKF